MLLNGLAYHHSGLSLDERMASEHLFKKRLLKVLFCTTTLATGVNLPAKRVVIASCKVGMGTQLTTSQYKQMVGRAGRLGFDKEADSVLIAPRKEIGMEIATRQLEHVKSALHSQIIGLPRVILEAIGTGLAQDEYDLLNYLQSTLYWQQRPDYEEVEDSDRAAKQLEWLFGQGKEALDFLVYNEIVKQIRKEQKKEETSASATSSESGQVTKEFRFEISQLGKAILRSGLSPEEGLLVYLDLMKANKGMILSNELHQLYLLTPVSLSFSVQWKQYHQIYKLLTTKSKVDSRICQLIGITEDQIVSYGHGGGINRKESRFKRDVIKLPKSPSREAYENAKSDQKKLHSEIESFKAFADNNKELI